MSTEYIVDGAYVRGDVAQVSFRDLGTIIYEGDFIFPTRIMETHELTGIHNFPGLEEVLANFDELEEQGITADKITVINEVYGKNNKHVVQVRAKPSAASTLRKIQDVWNQYNPKVFRTTHLTDQLRWYVAQTGDKFNFSQELEYVIRTATDLTVSIQEVWSKVKGSRGNTRKELISKIVDPVMNQINQFVEETSEILENYDFWLQFNENKRALEVHTNTLDYIERTGFMTPDDIRNAKIAFVDTENPLFKQEGSQTSWYGIAIYENQKPVRKVIFALYPMDIDTVPGMDMEYEIISGFDSFTEFERAINDLLVKEDVWFFVGQNIIWYDNQKMREDSLQEDGEFNFNFGKDDKGKVKSTSLEQKIDAETGDVFYKKMFQYVGADRKVFLDTYQIARIGLSFLPNLKLKTILNFLFPESNFEKIITYDEMEDLESRFRAGDMEAGHIQARYLASDVDNMVPLILDTKTQFNNIGSVTPYSFDDLCEISSRLRLDFDQLTNGTGVMANYYERKFFENVGTYFDSEYHFTQKEQKRNKSRKARFQYRVKNMHITPGEKVQELPPETVLVYFPWADYVAEKWRDGRLRDNYPEFWDFLEGHKYQREARTTVSVSEHYTIRHDVHRQFFITKYLESFMTQMVFDYAAAVLEENASKRKLFWGRYGFEPEMFMGMIEGKKDARIKELSDAGMLLLRTDSEKQVAFVYAPDKSFEDIYASKALPLIRVSGEIA